MPVLAGDSREAWKPDVLADPRVTQLWDQNQVVGTWLQRHGGPFWDAFLVYAPTDRWTGRPTTLGDWARPSSATPTSSRTLSAAPFESAALRVPYRGCPNAMS